jgi:apolipoprotein N-acyltransferase
VAALSPPVAGDLSARVKGAFLAVFAIVALCAVKASTPHKAAVARLADIPLTCLGIAAIDFAAFHVAHGWGWLVLGISLIIVEHLIADDDDRARHA